MDQIVSTMKKSLGIQDLRKPVPLIRSVVSEMMGTMLLIIIGVGPACSQKEFFSIPSGCFGLAAMGVVYYTGHISGGNNNTNVCKRSKLKHSSCQPTSTPPSLSEPSLLARFPSSGSVSTVSSSSSGPL